MEWYQVSWNNPQQVDGIKYICGYCGALVAPAKGWNGSSNSSINGYVLICTNCNRPSFIERSHNEIIKTTPAPKIGNSVNGLPSDVSELYEEARSCTSAGAFTAAVLICRKILMHIAVEKGDKPGKSFIDYVEFLATKGYIPPDGKDWVDHIRTKSNEANHEIVVMTPKDAEDLITFTEMLLRFVYEFKQRLPGANLDIPPPPE